MCKPVGFTKWVEDNYFKEKDNKKVNHVCEWCEKNGCLNGTQYFHKVGGQFYPCNCHCSQKLVNDPWYTHNF